MSLIGSVRGVVLGGWLQSFKSKGAVAVGAPSVLVPGFCDFFLVTVFCDYTPIRKTQNQGKNTNLHFISRFRFNLKLSLNSIFVVFQLAIFYFFEIVTIVRDMALIWIVLLLYLAISQNNQQTTLHTGRVSESSLSVQI